MATVPAVAHSVLSRGSVWRKWDLHVHGPCSALNNQFPHLPNATCDWTAYIDALEALADITVLGITDYFTVESYRKVREFKQQGRLKNISLLLPNIEFRLDKLVGTTNQRRLNYHVIFSELVSPEEIEEHFLQELKFSFQGDPQRTDLSWSVRRSNLELLGNRLKQEHAPFNDGRSDFEIGCMNATVDPAKIKEVLAQKERIFKGKYVVVLAEEHTGLLDWNGQDHLLRKVLLQGADAIFSANPSTIAWSRGEGDLTPNQFRKEFKSLKPCIHGSDAHRLDDICKPAQDRFCWIKAETTFEGLKQILYEPRERIFVGEKPPKLKNDYQVVESIEIADADTWFTPVRVPLNEDLAAIIGPRGSGKSALAELIAFAGGAEIFRTSQNVNDTFLFKASKKSVANTQPIIGAKITLHWLNGTDEPATIPQNLHHEKQEEKIKYLPQKFVERLCAPENNRQLEEEIERVIFQRIDKTERLNASNFQDLRTAVTQSIQIRRTKLLASIQTLNQTIADNQVRIATKPQKELELKNKREDLKKLIEKAPQLPDDNKQDFARIDALTKEKHQLEIEITQENERLAALDAIGARFEVIRSDLTSFEKEISELLAKVDLYSRVQDFTVKLPDNYQAILAAKRAEVTGKIKVLREGSGVSDLKSVSAITAQVDALKKSSQLTQTKRQEYEKFIKDRQQLELLIAALEKEIQDITNVITPRVKSDSDAREDRYIDALDLLKEEKTVLERLYAPLRDALLASNDTAKKLKFVSRTTFHIQRHASRAMELLDRRKGVFREQSELELVLKKFFEEIEDKDFEHGETKKALHDLRESFLVQDGKRIRLDDQLRKDRTPKDFADWFYSIDDFSVTYSIKFDSKDLHLLSPGEKGVVLLLLYLEAENEDNRPLIIDQPDDNLDNVSVYPTLIEYFRTRKRTRQIVIITHNPNLVVNTDAEQILVANFDGSRVPKIDYRSGALENTETDGASSSIRDSVCKILEGGSEAFLLREQRYAID